MNLTIDPLLGARIAALLGERILAISRVEGGYTPALRVLCTTPTRRVFVKVGATPLTNQFLRREIRMYKSLRGEFMAELVAAEDDPQTSILIIEDLSGCHWPPPWTTARIDAALGQIAAVHRTPAAVETFAQANEAWLSGGTQSSSWQTVAADPTPLLALGIADAAWLDIVLPVLITAELGCSTTGDSLCHWDLRSDNLCFAGDRALLIDWNFACLSNPRLDLGGWLPSLAWEGGPLPEVLLPDAPEVAAWVAGFFAARAGLAPIPDAPRVRRVQWEQLQTALPWAQRALGLPPLPRMQPGRRA